MENNINDKFNAIRKGLLEFAVMNVIKGEPVYAANIIERLAPTEFTTQEGTLYPLLSKMRRDRLLEYEWQESESGPPRKYYRLTSHGKERLAETEAYWQEIIATLKHLNK